MKLTIPATSLTFDPAGRSPVLRDNIKALCATPVGNALAGEIREDYYKAAEGLLSLVRNLEKLHAEKGYAATADELAIARAAYAALDHSAIGRVL